MSNTGINVSHISNFGKIIDPSLISDDPQIVSDYGGDWCKAFKRKPSLVLFPKTTQQVSSILSYCHENKLCVVPSGGRTGLAGGATAQNHEIVLSLDKMNKIRNIDPVSLTVEVESGVTTQALQEAAKAHHLFFPLDLAAKGSSHIGGNLATNAGGLKFIRFGGARDLVLGIEVVLASGEILNLNSQVRKNNCGYDLKQLFIGSEGTLGIITKATLKLTPPPHKNFLSCLGLHSMESILEVFKLCHQSHFQISAFEYLTEHTFKLVQTCFPDSIKNPFQDIYPYYLLIELESHGNEALNEIEEFLASLFEKDILADAVIASSSEEEHALWSIRENISEGLAMSGPVVKNDISIPISLLAEWEEEFQSLSKAHPELDTFEFGHIGDGNLHLNYLGPKDQKTQDFYHSIKHFQEKVYTLVKKFKGSISAEHGIGLLKKDDLHFTRCASEIYYMRKIKEIFDPHKILNPGKIFD